MQINLGTHYINRTWKYLVPCVSEYGSTFKSKYNSLFKFAVGIHDTSFDNTRFQKEKLLYILIDKKYRPPITENIIQWFTYQSFFIHDYAFDDIITGRKHMLVIRIPGIYEDAYDEFIAGRYSFMYTDQQLHRLFMKNTPEKGVLMRTDSAKEDFIKKIYASFGTEIKKEELIGAELDFPLEKQKEIFNY